MAVSAHSSLSVCRPSTSMNAVTRLKASFTTSRRKRDGRASSSPEAVRSRAAVTSSTNEPTTSCTTSGPPIAGRLSAAVA